MDGSARGPVHGAARPLRHPSWAIRLLLAGLALLVLLLVAVALPSLFDPRASLPATAADRTAQANLTAAAISAGVYAAVNQGELPGTAQVAAVLRSAHPLVTYTTGPSDGPDVVSYAVAGSVLTVAAHSPSGACWFAAVNRSGTTAAGRPPGVSYNGAVTHPCTATLGPVTPWWPKFPGG